MKKLTFILLFCSGILFAQEVKFVWISHLSNNSEKETFSDSLVNYINKNKIDFVVLTDQVTKTGSLQEFEDLQTKLDELQCKYFLLPGIDELKNNGLLNYRRVWYDLNFSFQIKDKKFLGISGENFLNNEKNSFTPETIDWLNEELSDSTLNYFLFINGDLINDYNNYEKILQNMNKLKSFTLISGSTELSNSLKIPAAGYRENKNDYCLYPGQIENDTLMLGMQLPDNTFEKNQIITLQRSGYAKTSERGSPIEENNKVIFKKEFKSTLIAKPIFYDNKIFICERKGIISALDTLGNLIWDADAYGDIVSTPVIADGKLVVATRQGDLITMNANTGEILQTLGFDDAITSDLLAIEYQGNKQLLIEKQEDSKTAIVLGTASGKVFCYDLETLQEYWINKDPKNFITSPMKFEDNRIVTITSKGDIYCIDAKRGWTIWKWNEAEKKDKNIYEYKTLIHKQMIFVASSSGYVYGIDLLLGKTNWRSDKFKPCNSIGLTSNKNLLLVKVSNVKLIKLSQKTGTNLNVLRYSNGEDNAHGVIFNEGESTFITSNTGDIFEIKDFKKTEKVFSTNNQLILDVLPLDSKQYLISTVEGQVTLTYLK